jgi:spore germination cell wall hydrolase CwlJ-like protein
MIDPGSFSFQVGVRTLWQEARGEPEIGKRAVAHVLANRLNSGKWGHTLGEVCLSPLQFSGWNAKDPNRIASARLADNDSGLVALAQILTDALDGNDPDPTEGAMFYFNPSIVRPDWASSMHACGQFGNQLFFK